MNAMFEKLQQRVSDRDAALEVSTVLLVLSPFSLQFSLCVPSAVQPQDDPKGDCVFCVLFVAQPSRGVL